MNKTIKTTFTQDLFRIILGIMMVFVALAHFTFQREEFQAQVPKWIPLSKDLVIILSGIAEITLGLLLIFWTSQKAKVGFALAIFFILIFPGNIAQYVNGISAFGLETDRARFIRLFFQPVLILWALWSAGSWQAFKTKNKID